MKVVLAFLALCALASSQRYGFGFNGGISHGGGPIRFPSTRPRPGRPVYPIGGVGGVGGIGGVGGVGGFGGVKGVGGVGGVGGVKGVGGVGGVKGVGGVGGIGGKPGCPAAGCPIGANEPRLTYLYACKPLIAPYVHYTANDRDYHFSWCNDGGKKYEWQAANSYCTSLPGGDWYGISIESAEENYLVTSIIEGHRLPYIWTSGSRLYTPKFTWSNGNPLTFTYWGKTGGLGIPQPDNHEGGNEPCLGILNHFYPGDTTTWHDIQCYHPKPIICERPSIKGGYGHQG